MRVDDGSICGDCKFFEHDCDIPCGEDDYCCAEWCHCKDKNIANTFYNSDDKIKECKCFEDEW